MKKYLLLFSILPGVFISSCKKEATFETFPEYHQKIDINAFISPDLKENIIFVTSSVPRFGETKLLVPSGKISLFLYENSEKIELDTTLIFKKYSGYYFKIKNVRFEGGHTYQLKIKSDLGLEAEATCTVPTKRNYKIELDTSHVIITNIYGTHPSIVIKPSIEDYAGEKNYYRVLYQLNSHKNGKIHHIENFDEGDLVFNDDGKDGKKIMLRQLEIRDFWYTWDTPDSCILRIYLLNTDRPYYDFHKSVENYHYGEEPFTEPSFLYSNVRGGVGIFASYVVDSLLFKIK